MGQKTERETIIEELKGILEKHKTKGKFTNTTFAAIVQDVINLVNDYTYE